MSAKGLQYSVLLACAAVASGGCSALDVLGSLDNQLKGSGRPASEARKVGDFDKIRDDGAANLKILVGLPTGVKVEGDDNIVPFVKTSVENGELIIKTKKNFRSKVKLLVTITTPTLNTLQLDGAGNISVNNAKADNFTIGLDGAGNVTADGTVNSLTATIDGAGNLKLGSLKSRTATATVDGAGNIDVWATDNLTATVDGVGNIRYKGSPQVQKSVEGVGRIEQRD